MEQEHAGLLIVAARCADACEQCAAACLLEEDVKKMADCIKLDRDCADLCRLVGAFAARGSSFTLLLSSVLADLCKACCSECSKHPMDHCRVCASACRACEAACSDVRTV
ncbi:MAG TPA: four-helix bundle copper-binding protein [Polyangiaceae bacterium]|nr:four-helix bundle copper-binding protein [Polyangiaceae bacterium]